MRLRRLLLPALAFALLVAPLGAQGGVPPLGPLRGGAQLLDDQGENNPPRAAMLPGGRAVVVWSDLPSGGIDLQDLPIRAAATVTSTGLLFQLLDERGEPAGQIEEVGASFVEGYAVASDAAGDFAVAWEGDDEIVLRRYRADGSPADLEPIQITSGGGLAIGPDVAVDRAGNAVVTWSQQVTTDTLAVLARSLPARTATPGDVITVTNAVSATVDSLAVARGDAGFVVAWQQGDSEGDRVYASTYAAGATAPAATSTVATLTDTAYALSNVDAAMAPDGRFVVAWNDERTQTIGAQPYAPDGSTRGARVAITDVSPERGPGLAIDAAGNFALAYHHSSDEDIRIERYSADGAPANPRLVQPVNEGFVPSPALAANAEGELVLAWYWAGEIYSQLFRRPAVEVLQFRDEGEPALDTRVAEGGREDSFFVGLRTTPTGPVTVTLTPLDGQVRLSFFGSDLQVAQAGEPLRVSFSPTSPGGLVQVRVTALDDADAEGLHRDRIEVTAAGAGTGYDALPLLLLVDGAPADEVAVSVVDNDSARYAVSSNSAGTTEGSGQPVVFSVARTAGAAGRSAVAYRFVGTARFGADGDYTASGPDGPLAATGVLTFTAGEQGRAIRLTIVDDPLGEPLKTIGLQLTGAVPEDAGSLSFPVALVALGDDDLAEVRIAQTGGGTMVRRGDPPDRLAVSLRTAPAHPVEVTLTPTDRRLSVGRGYGAPLRLTFAADESAKQQQWVEVSTLPAGVGAGGLAANAGISLAARSADPGYDRGARFTVDGRDLGTIPVEVVTRPGENPNPPVPSAYLPLLVR